MFRLDWYQPQASGPVRLIVSGELSPAAHEAMVAALERARQEAVSVELDLHDVTRVDRSVVCGLAQLCAQGVSFGRCPAYLERWFREERAASDPDDPGEGSAARPTGG